MLCQRNERGKEMRKTLIKGALAIGTLFCASSMCRAESVKQPIIAQASPTENAKIAVLEKEAASGDVKAQFNLGRLYDEGDTIPQDYAKAAQYYQKAADKGLIQAQFNLGNLYDKGQGVPQNYSKAITYYQKSLDQGYEPARDALDEIYENHPDLKPEDNS
ncbi:sel1 repeat family protein [Acetobacteraceae bacterium]|nr:sel1 repeat family protein [Acetobacteraceae bacterium]